MAKPFACPVHKCLYTEQTNHIHCQLQSPSLDKKVAKLKQKTKKEPINVVKWVTNSHSTTSANKNGYKMEKHLKW